MTEPSPDEISQHGTEAAPAGGRVRLPLRRRRASGWLRLLRPLALLAGTATAVGFAWTLDGSPAWHEVVRVALVMASTLAAASIFNDAADAEFDHNAHVWRPIPSGLVRVDQAQRAATLAAVVALALAASLDWIALLLVFATLILAYLYSARMRGTYLAWVAWSLSFALAPLWIGEAVGAFDDVLWWSFPVGIVAGLAAYLVIKLPDYERDDVDGARNVLHWLTIDYAVPVTWGALASLIVVAVASANVENLRAEWIIPSATTAIVLELVLMGVLFFGVTERRLVWQRWTLSFAIVAMSIGWLGSIAP